MILEIDEPRRRLSLGMKQCKANPWDDFSATHAKGDKVSGQIKSITDFGVFIGLPGGIDGLVHLSDLSWTQTGEEASRNFKKGDDLEAVILAVDVEKERISLGVKQLAEDPNGGAGVSDSSDSKAKGKTKAKEMKMEDDGAAAGTTSLGALLKAKLDGKK
jgi:small subunit ribosomal protein S1